MGIANIKRASKAAAKAVGNMSLGGGKSDAVNTAVNAAHDAEVIMAVAGGNDGRDACNYSPASAEKSICAGASSNGVAMKLMWEYKDYDADKIKDEMLSIATQNKLSGVRGSPNKLAFHGCID